MPKGLRLISCLLPILLGGAIASAEETDAFAFADLERPEHDYWNRTPKDPFTRIKDDLESLGMCAHRPAGSEELQSEHMVAGRSLRATASP